MTIQHHPTEETLAAFAADSLDRGRALVVAAHMETCPRCDQWIADLRRIGGTMLEDLAPAPMRPDALARALAAVDTLSAEPIATPKETSELAPGIKLPRALSDCRLGDWHWIGPGIHRRVVETDGDLGGSARVFLLRARPRTRMPQHTHTGTELTLVLSGAFTHEGGRFGAGDLEEADAETEHQPVVQPGEVCICLVAMEGDLALSGVLGRLMQPFVRI
jgi:putative transcriptional regulator